MVRKCNRWRVASQEPLRLRCWDGDYVVYNPLSGQTHFLELLTGRILELIILETPTTDQIYSFVAAFLDLDSEDLVIEAIDNHLYLLKRVVLIERAP